MTNETKLENYKKHLDDAKDYFDKQVDEEELTNRDFTNKKNFVYIPKAVPDKLDRILTKDNQ